MLHMNAIEVSRAAIETFILDEETFQWSISEEDLGAVIAKPFIYDIDIIKAVAVHPKQIVLERFDVGVEDLEKRTNAMITLIEECSPTMEKYNRNQAREFIVKLHNAGRPDLVAKMNRARRDLDKRRDLEATKELMRREFD